MLRYWQILGIVTTALCCASALAQTRNGSKDSVKRLPERSVEITAMRPSDLPTIDARGVEIKPAAELSRITGSTITSSALNAISSSLDVRDYGSLGGIALPSFRGLPPEYTIIYRDGIRLTNEQLGETDLGQLTLHGISNVELIPSSNAVQLGGDAIGAAINLVSEVVDSNALTLGTEQTNYEGASGFPTQSYYAKASINAFPNFSIVTGGSLDQSTGAFPFYQDSANPKVIRQNNDAALRSADIAALWTASENTSIRFLGNYFYANRGAGGAAVTPGFGATSLSARQSDAQTFAAVKADHDIGPLASTLSISYERQFESYRDLIQSTNDSAWNTMLDASFRGSYSLDSTLKAFGGIETDHTVLTGTTNRTANNDSIISRERRSGYVAAKYVPADDIDLNGSLRVENISDLSLTELLPQAAINYVPISGLTFGGAYSKSFHAPTLNDLYWTQGGNPRLQPEHGDNWQASIEWEPEIESSSVKLGATAFLAHIQNEIVWEPYIGTEWSPINIGDVESKGIELRAEGRIPISSEISLRIEESYTWLDAKNITSGDQNYGNEIQYSSPTRSLFIAELQQQNYGSFSIMARYRGHEFSDPAKTDAGKLQPVTVFNATLASKEFSFMSTNAKLAFSVLDVTNEHYEEVINYPLPSRTYNLSIELTYH